MIEAVLARPGVREMMKVYGDYREKDRVYGGYRAAIARAERITTTDRSNAR